MKTIILNKDVFNRTMKILFFVVFFCAAGSLFAETAYSLPDERRDLIRDGAVGSLVNAEVREREIVYNGDEVWCELLSGVRSNFYVTLVFSRGDFERAYTVEDRMSISCIVTGSRQEENQAAVGNITTYYLDCEPEGDFSSDSAAAGEARIYQILEIIDDADFDNSFMESVDSLQGPYPAGGVFFLGDFPTLEGNSVIYKFISTYWGNSYLSGGEEVFHDLLAVRTDLNNNIQEAYHYTLEWGDVPSEDLYHADNINKKLDSELNVGDLGLRNVYGVSLQDNGILDNILFGYEQF